MTTLEILRAARNHLSDPGNWLAPHNNWNIGARAGCASNAISRATDDGNSNLPAHDALLRALGRPAGVMQRRLADIYEWNDSPSTTHADLLAAFDRAIANEEAREQEFSGDLIIDEPALEVERV